MELEQQKAALQKLLLALTTQMESKLKIVNSKDDTPSLVEIAQEFCQMLQNKQVLEEELAKVTKEAAPTQMRRN